MEQIRYSFLRLCIFTPSVRHSNLTHFTRAFQTTQKYRYDLVIRLKMNNIIIKLL